MICLKPTPYFPLRKGTHQPTAPPVSKLSFLPDTEGSEVNNLSMPLEKKKFFIEKAAGAT